jgi:uncharacterized membrane protein
MTLLLGFPVILSDADDWTKTKKFVAVIFTICLDLMIIIPNLPRQ